VKKNKLHITVSVLLLALMMVSRIGIHIFHHHESTSSVESITLKNAVTLLPSVSDHDEADCMLCKLDSFQEILTEEILPFIFVALTGKAVYRFLLKNSLSFSFLKQNKGPPVFTSVA
jgi:hypothetical protein